MVLNNIGPSTHAPLHTSSAVCDFFSCTVPALFFWTSKNTSIGRPWRSLSKQHFTLLYVPFYPRALEMAISSRKVKSSSHSLRASENWQASIGKAICFWLQCFCLVFNINENIEVDLHLELFGRYTLPIALKRWVDIWHWNCFLQFSSFETFRIIQGRENEF